MFDARDIRRDLGPAQPLVDQSLANLQTPGTRWVAQQVSGRKPSAPSACCAVSSAVAALVAWLYVRVRIKAQFLADMRIFCRFCQGPRQPV